MTGESLEPLVEALRSAEADFRLSGPRANDRVVTAAVDLLADGMTTDAVVALAGDDRAEREEVERDLDHVLIELGLRPFGLSDAAVRASRDLAIAVLEGRTAPLDAAQQVWRYFVAADGPEALSEFAHVADGLDCLPEYFTEDDFRRAAAEFVAADDVPAT